MADDGVVAFFAQHVAPRSVVVAVAHDPEADAEVGAAEGAADVLPAIRWKQTTSVQDAGDDVARVWDDEKMILLH